MKINFKKISAIGASVLLTGMTMGVAAAASYPTPFVVGGSANAAVVYGALGALDVTPAYQLNVNLGEYVDAADTGTTGTINAEDSYLFEKTSTKFHLGDPYVNLSTTLDEDELPLLLADGKYIDDDNDEIDYTQKITMGSLNQLMMFDDDDYETDSPTIGFRIPSSQTILTYQIDFSDTLLVTDMPTTDLPLMGKSYYVLSNTSTTLTLLDSAASAIVSAGEEITLDVDGTTYTVSASIFDTSNSKVKLSINGELTNLLGNTETQKLTDGAYIGIKEVVVQNFANGVNQVEFSIGKGKLKITKGSSNTEVQVNDNSVSGLTANYTEVANVISQIKIIWAADDVEFITEDATLTMPSFETVKLSFGGLNYPAEEMISVKQGGTTYATLDNFPLKNGEADIDFMYGNSTYFTGVGKDATHQLLTDANNDGNITFDDNSVHDYFIASWTDTNDAESYLLKFMSFDDTTSNNVTDLYVYKNGAWSLKKENVKATDTIQLGNVDITIGAVNKLGSIKNVEVWDTSSTTSFNTLYSAEGLTVYLPYLNTSHVDYYTGNDTFTTAVTACDWAQVEAVDAVGELGYAGIVQYNSSASATATDASSNVTCVPEATTFALKMVEEDKSENKYSGDHFNLSIGWDSSTTPEVQVSDVVGEEVTFKEIGDTDVWRSFMYSALATEFLWNKPTSGQKSVEVIYHGSEVAASAWITSPEGIITGSSNVVEGSLGDVVMKDTDLAAGETRNLIIVGGSCVNTAAASVLGVSAGTCGDDWTSATGVGSGQFVIESFGSSSLTSGIALLVAGYEVADTTNAVTYLKTQVVDTAAGKKYIGTNSQTAELIVE